MTMKQNKVKFTIAAGGAVKMEVVDGIGSSCAEATKDIEVSLSRAGKKVDEGKKPEFFESEGSLSVFNNNF